MQKTGAAVLQPAIVEIVLRYFGIVYFVTLSAALFFVNVFIICPQSLGGSAGNLVVGSAVFIWCNAALNFWLFHVGVRRNRAPASAFGDVDENFCNRNSLALKHCDHCGFDVTLQSFHCTICNYCVLEGDHHCLFLGGCIGIGNQRYYIVLLFWALIGSFGSTILIGYHLNQFYKPVWDYGWIDYVLPVFLAKWVFGFCEPDLEFWSNFGFRVLFMLGFSAVMASLSAFIVQWICLISGYSVMMESRRPRDYRSVPERLKSIFGRYWLLNFLVPLPFSNRVECFNNYCVANSKIM